MKKIVVYNLSTMLSNVQFTKMISAINLYLGGVCNDWNVKTFSLVAGKYNPTAAPIPSIFMFDNTDDASALGYHYEESGVPLGSVFVKTVLDYGGAILYSNPTTPTVAQCLAHEALEMLGNSQINKWYSDNYGELWAGELCDPVQERLLTVNLNGTTKVGLSDYVLPAWFSPNSTSGPYNKLNTLTSPFSLDQYGYAIKIVNGELVAVYGEKVTERVRKLAEEKIAECKFDKSAN